MNAERKLTLIYFVLGVVMGVLSVKGIEIGTLSVQFNTAIAIGIGAFLYVISFLIIWFTGEGKKFSWYVINTLLTYALVWLVTWIFVFNL